MEKKKPHYDLLVIKALIDKGKVSTTAQALAGGATLGFNYVEILKIVRTLNYKDFYKSMTAYSNHKEWQDVYRISIKDSEIYIKIMVINDVLILSFKEL
jgi:motility quorum-sensing regulator / GCU-specific mRNA interferase toxin